MSENREPGDGPPEDEAPRGADRWKEETKGIERILDVVFTLDAPRTAGWIGDEALVSEQTTREHLDMFADLGVVSATTVGGVTKYQPDAAWLRFKEVASYVERFSKDELMDHVESRKERIRTARERYGVESPDELRAEAADADTPVEDVQEYRRAAAEWEAVEHDLDVCREALERYDEYDRDRVTAYG